MNVIISTIALTGTVLLIYELLMRSRRSTNPEGLREEVHQRWKHELQRLIDESPLPSGDANSWLTQQLGLAPESNENVTPFPTGAANWSHCPACGAGITVHDERCPSCDIAFIADGSQTWTLGTVGPADGIFLPPTEVKK